MAWHEYVCGGVQAASNEQAVLGSGSLSPDAVSRTLHIQAAKVVAAHAASVGDNLLGVPLLCSAGEFRLASGTSISSLHVLHRRNVWQST